MKLDLRPYQVQGLTEIRSLYAQSTRKVLLKMPTGAGKTVVFCVVMKGAYEKGKSVIMVVRGRDLVDQASKRLSREGVPHGVMMSGHWNYRPHERVQVCSIDTLYKRKEVPRADLIVIDEAHMSACASFKWLLDALPDVFVLSVTATPYLAAGMRHCADAMVAPVSITDLIRDGFLVAPRYYVPSIPDLRGVRIDSKTQDYSSTELAERMDNAAIFGSMLDSWKTYAEGRPTLCFAVNVEHSKHIAEQFNAKGISAIHVDANAPQSVRDAAKDGLETGKYKIICNVGIMTTGVDIPCIGCILMARPTKSYNLYVQILGRGTRLHLNKYDFIVLDHANNIREHGFIENEPEVNLDGHGTKRIESAFKVCTCVKCYFTFDPRNNHEKEEKKLNYVCPDCGTDNSPKPREVLTGQERTDESVDLVEIKISEFHDLGKPQFNRKFQSLMKIAMRKGHKPGWIFYRMKDEFGPAVAGQALKAAKELLGEQYASASRARQGTGFDSEWLEAMSRMDEQHRAGEG